MIKDIEKGQRVSDMVWREKNKSRLKDYYKNWRKEHPDYSKEYYKKNTTKLKLKSREWSNKHRDKIVKRIYGLSEEDFKLLLLSQNNKCAICHIDFGKGILAPHVDHDHETGIIRGLLCRRCNSGLGFFHDNELLILEALNYIKRNLC